MIAWLLVEALAGPGVPLGECPEPYAASASRTYEQMLVEETAASEVAFADCLAHLGLLHSAQRHYLEVVGGEDRSPAWHQAVDRSMALVDALGDPHSVLPYLRGVDPRRVQATVGRSALYFVNGQSLMLEGRYELAAVRMEEVEPKSAWGRSTTFYQAEAMALADRQVPALELYEAVPLGPLYAQAQVRRIRILAALGRTSQALELMGELEDPQDVAQMTPYRAQLHREQGRGDLAREAARDAIRLSRSHYIPESDLVAGEIAADTCRVARAERHLERFHAAWDGVRMALDTSVNVGNVDGNRLYDQWLGEDAPLDWGLPVVVVDAVVQPQPATDFLTGHLAELGPERARIREVPDDAFQALVAPHLERVVHDGERQLRYLLGHALRARIQDMHAELLVHERAADRLEARIASCTAQD